MPTLLVSRSCQPESDGLAREAARLGWACRWLRRGRRPARLTDHDCCFYGETDLAIDLMRDSSIRLLEPTLDLLAQLPEKYVARRIKALPLAEAAALTEPAFIKPADCTDKAFEAKVYERGEFIRCRSGAPANLLTLVSEPVDWDVEYRLIVLERRIVTFSPYIRGGWLAKTTDNLWPCDAAEVEALHAFCKPFLEDRTFDLPPAFTLDVGMIAARGWAIVELNPVWCSGLLGCNLSLILRPLERACRNAAALTADDARWIIDRRARTG